MALTKAEIVQVVVDNVGLNKREALEMVEASFEEISTSLEAGVNGGRNPPKSGGVFISGSENASLPTRDTAPKRCQGQAAALCSLAKRTLDAA